MKRKRSPQTSGVVQGLLDYLDETGQKRLIDEVYGELSDIVKKKKAADVVRIESIVPLSPDQKKRVQAVVRQRLGKDLPVKNIINKSLIGGIKIFIGDWFFDASISTEIDRLKKALY